MARKAETVVVGGKSLELSNLDKVLFSREGVTKAEVIRYYTKVGEAMLPFLKDRPLMLNRFPHGVGSKSFVQKHWDHHPKWVKTFRVSSESRRKATDYAICNDLPTLVWLANMACIEINQFMSTIPEVDRHDIVLIDLDPHPPASFEDAVEVGRLFETALKQMKLLNLVKTSGAGGIHILVPVQPRYDIETIRKFVYTLGRLIESLDKRATVARSFTSRVGKVYIDYGQNGLKKTIAAPYSIRPQPGAPVSFPVSARRLRKGGFDYRTFTVRSVPSLVRKERPDIPSFAYQQVLEPAFKELGVSLN